MFFVFKEEAIAIHDVIKKAYEDEITSILSDPATW